ncbi:hypothetical protein TRAPUB_6987 [Trametes pubescens]|uniref:Uncharacterized protein n=1 Tax=Trametes pubescens TaxID=154538 RepID=A0A1M2V4D9_TRAPU|nr:hypothetical protein TRAPUB_6987 [Trametes pubescens]
MPPKRLQLTCLPYLAPPATCPFHHEHKSMPDQHDLRARKLNTRAGSAATTASPKEGTRANKGGAIKAATRYKHDVISDKNLFIRRMSELDPDVLYANMPKAFENLTLNEREQLKQECVQERRQDIRLTSPTVALPGCNPVSGCSDSPSTCSGQPYPHFVAAHTRLLDE